jgi:hypothetical protein
LSENGVGYSRLDGSKRWAPWFTSSEDVATGDNDKIHRITNIFTIPLVSSCAPPLIVDIKRDSTPLVLQVGLVGRNVDGVFMKKIDIDKIELVEDGLAFVPDEVYGSVLDHDLACLWGAGPHIVADIAAIWVIVLSFGITSLLMSEMI